MALRWLLRPNTYHDSVRLMRVSEALSAEPGVVRAAAVMATPLNLSLLKDDGLLPPDASATSEDLLVAVLGETEDSAETAVRRVDDLLRVREPEALHRAGVPVRTIERAAMVTDANVAVIAVPGQFAAAEAFAALRAGMHVFLFSDNVTLKDEYRLKELAISRDLLMMGPDCGTAIINGVGLGFANRVRRGPVGIIGASGTGIQQVSCLLDLAGVGVAQAIGTGGRDLSGRVAAAMTRQAMTLLEADDEVEVIVVISKPPHPRIVGRLHRRLMELSKPAVACLLGDAPADAGNVRYAATLTDAARMVVELTGGDTAAWWLSDTEGTKRAAGKTVHGLFAGGTLCSEAGRVLDALGAQHELVDLGSDEYTRGRAHPMIDPRLRAAMLAELAGRNGAGAILLDVVLGDLAHPDPAGTLAPVVKRLARSMPVLAVLIGTRADPQGLDAQRAILEAAGAAVFSSNADAAAAAGRAVGARG